jgi:hypothetical protein
MCVTGLGKAMKEILLGQLFFLPKILQSAGMYIIVYLSH